MEVKPIESITKQVVKQCLIQKVIPAIKGKWPQGSSRRIFIQQDNAKPHISPLDADFLRAAKSDGFDMELICQPPNSPDLNILDLGFFRSIQTLQHKKSPKSICQLVDSVVRAFEQIDDEKLKFVWISLHACMNEIMKVKGSNSYHLPHIGKKRLQSLRRLQTQLTPDKENVANAIQVLDEAQHNQAANRNNNHRTRSNNQTSRGRSEHNQTTSDNIVRE